MTKYLYSVGSLVLLSGAFVLAQNMPQHKQPQQYPPMPQTQQQPPTSDQSKTSAANMADVQNEIQTALQKDPTLTGANINVQVTEKNVELTGTVPSRDAKYTAEQIAKAHSGGLGVKNRLKVSQGSSGPKTPYM
jgi:osmotically-inducible protein OsmY